MNKCIFCNHENITDILVENDLAYCKFDGFPVSKGHALIIPKRHVASFFDTTTQERDAINDLIEKAKELIDNMFHPDGYNIGINCGESAGQSIMHVHVHLIPRYKGDVENPRGGVRGVIPQKQNYSAN